MIPLGRRDLSDAQRQQPKHSIICCGHAPRSHITCLSFQPDFDLLVSDAITIDSVTPCLILQLPSFAHCKLLRQLMGNAHATSLWNLDETV